MLEFRGNMHDPANTLLKVAEFKKAKPETVHSFEIGYRGVIANKLLIDAYFYTSKYEDFIGRAAVARGVPVTYCRSVPANKPIDFY